MKVVGTNVINSDRSRTVTVDDVARELDKQIAYQLSHGFKLVSHSTMLTNFGVDLIMVFEDKDIK